MWFSDEDVYSVEAPKESAYQALEKAQATQRSGGLLYCVLVESQRVDGLPRQKVICYLGSLDEGDREKLWLRVDFWDGVEAKLDQLNLFPRERAKIEHSIGLIVERVPADEVAKFKREREAWWQGLEQLIRLRNIFSNLRKAYEGKRS